jgi:hypothetical protein
MKNLNPKDRFLYALQIRKSLHSLMTSSEAEMHEGIFEYLQDYINELAEDIEVDLPNLPQYSKALHWAFFICLLLLYIVRELAAQFVPVHSRR